MSFMKNINSQVINFKVLSIGGCMKRLSVVPLILAFIILACSKKENSTSTVTTENLGGKQIFYVDSYHSTYAPNIKTRESFERQLEGLGIEIHYLFLDAKNIKDSELLEETGEEIFDSIQSVAPHLIIISDDAAMKYVVEPFLTSGTTPLVFVGVNWQAPERSENMTGQIEVELIDRLIEDLQIHSSGNRVGILTAETSTDHKNVDNYKNLINLTFADERFVSTFDEWKSSYVELQQTVDVLVVRQNSGIEGWDDNLANEWIAEHTTIPTGSPNLHMAPFVLLCYPKLNEEYGQFAGETALKILRGTAPSEIPIEQNRRSQITINTDIANHLEIIFSPEYLEIANLVPSEKKQVAFISSYHRGYDWSDGIEASFLKTVGIEWDSTETQFSTSEFDIQFFNLDSKRNSDARSIKNRADSIYSSIQMMNPDIIIGSDDNASKWLFEPYYKSSSTPILFCGLNWDASVYGFPTDNITGMVEVAPVQELVEFLKQYAKSDRIGYLAADVISERKEISHYIDILGIKFSDGALVSTSSEWKQKYLELQQSCDFIILNNHVGINDWNDDEMRQFVLENSSIPSGTTTRNVKHYAMITFSRIPEEQGMWVGQQMLNIFNGTDISAIPVTRNTKSSYYINPQLLNKQGIVLPASMLDSVFFVDEEIVR